MIAYDKNFFLNRSSTMYYILGFFCADGGISHHKSGTPYITFYSADLDLVKFIRRSMRSSHAISKRSARSGNVYRLQIGSKELVEQLQSLGLSSRKSKRMSVPNIPEEYVKDFIRGYFDGDGNVWTGIIHKKRATKHKQLLCCFTCANHLFLENLKEQILLSGALGGSLFRSKSRNFSRLQYSTKDSLKIYRFMYNGAYPFCLGRKKRVFEAFFKKYAAVAQR